MSANGNDDGDAGKAPVSNDMRLGRYLDSAVGATTEQEAP
jgi:hypothetical protein